MTKWPRVVIVLAMVLAMTAPSFAASGAKKEGEEGKTPEFEYVQLDPISLPVITPKGLTQQVSLLISLEVPYAKKEEIVAFKPRLTDAYIQDLYGALGGENRSLMRGSLIDVQSVKQRLANVTDKVLGPDLKAHDVLLQVVQQRPM